MAVCDRAPGRDGSCPGAAAPSVSNAGAIRRVEARWRGVRGFRNDPPVARELSGNAVAAPVGRHDRTGNRQPHRADARIRAGESLPWHEDASRTAGGNEEMNEQYLWDGSGETDPEIAQLEATLGRLRYRPRAKQRMRGMVFAAAAAAIVLAATGLWIFRTSVQFSSWQISGQRLRVGQQIETAGSGAVLESETTGRVEVDAGSRLRLIEPETFSLERGTIHALIWARPQTFVVETPAARTIDLGCQYTLRVERDGAGML